MERTLTTGEIIRWLRRNEGWTQEELGELLGVKKSAVQKYENNSIRNLKLDNIRALCKLFNVPPWVIIYPEDVRPELLQQKKLFQENVNSVMENSEILLLLMVLNQNGKAKAVQYMSDLTLIGKYTK